MLRIKASGVEVAVPAVTFQYNVMVMWSLQSFIVVSKKLIFCVKYSIVSLMEAEKLCRWKFSRDSFPCVHMMKMSLMHP